MSLSLYIALVQNKDEYAKPGITEDYPNRRATYEKGGNTVTFMFVAIALPGRNGLINTLENDGKIHFKKHFSKFNGLDRSEYINTKTTGITTDILEEYYRKKILKIPGIVIVKKQYLPLTRETPNLKNFLTDAIKYPKKYLEGF